MYLISYYWENNSSGSSLFLWKEASVKWRNLCMKFVNAPTHVP